MTAEIPAYQIHAVLQSLSRRLCGEQTAFPDGRPSAAQPLVRSGEDRWLQATIERVSDKIIDKITRLPAATAAPDAAKPTSRSGCRVAPPMQFVFHRLDEGQRKQRCVMPIEEANLLITRKRG